LVSSSKLSIAEQTRGNILLKAWEQNISESRGRAKEVRTSCEETFALINKALLDLDKEGSAGTLGKINIAKHLIDIKENEEKEQAEISQISQVDMVQVDKWLVQPSLQLWSIVTEDRQVGKRLPQLAKSCYTFEANNQAEPSRLIAQLVERCVNCIEQVKGQASGVKYDRCQSILFLEPEEQRKEGVPPAWGKTKSEEMKCFLSSIVIKGF
jgi:hypothetical protein